VNSIEFLSTTILSSIMFGLGPAVSIAILFAELKTICEGTKLSTAFVNVLPQQISGNKRCQYENSRRCSAVPYEDQPGEPLFSESVQEIATSILEEMPDDQSEVDALLAKKEERRAARQQRQTANAGNLRYKVTLPIVSGTLEQPPEIGLSADIDDKEKLASLVAKGQEIAVANSVGMSLRQVYSGRRLSELSLDVDTLRFQSFVDELRGRRVEGQESNGEDTTDVMGSIQVLQNGALGLLRETFDGVVVSSVTQNGLAWNAGVRAGDVLSATSATIGPKLWPKSTLDGVRSAISSRRVMSSSMDFEFRRRVNGEDIGVEAVESFELSLSRPIGINIEETDDGYVTVTGISDKAAPEVVDNLQIGDRVVSVESSFGGKMWEVYNADGLTSAVTSRLPGQPVRIVFERVLQEQSADVRTVTSESSVLNDAVGGFRQAGIIAQSPAGISSNSAIASQNSLNEMLLTRSRDLLKTYIARNEVTKKIKVADRVLEAVMDSSAELDGKTLNLVMKAYNTCNNAEKSIQTFEEVFGLAGDGSRSAVQQQFNGKLVADISALNIFTISSLLRSHALLGDYRSALRVLSAVEGNEEFSVDGKRSQSWLGKGDPLNMRPDTKCYNIVLAAAARRGTNEGLEAAVKIFDSMPNPSINNPPLGKPAKNLVTYNTMLNAFANFGQYQHAQDLFDSMKKTGVRPDRVTFTSLIKAFLKSGNLDKALDLLDDMKWVGIQPDRVSYNSIIEYLCNANRLFEARDLVNEMETSRISPDSMTYGLLMKGLLRSNKPAACLTLFESACADSLTSALTDNVQLYTTAITAAASLGDHERALELVSRMNRVGVKPNKKTLTALMSAMLAGRKYDAASDIFTKIRSPDSYAISVGLQALCYAGRFEQAQNLLAGQKCGQKALKGKQVMDGYNVLLRSSLGAGDFNMARDTLTGLLGAGYIPSKATFATIVEALRLSSDLTKFSKSTSANDTVQPHSAEAFEFCLFLVDSLDSRKLNIDPAFYSALLFSGARLGGLHRRIASLLSHSRNSSRSDRGTMSTLCESDVAKDCAPIRLASWEELYTDYGILKSQLGQEIELPSIRVSTKKGYGRILAAEQAVAYRK